MTDKCCATTGELRTVVEEVAEKAASSAVEKVHLQLRLELAEMERRISSDVSDVIDDRISKALGMTPQEHIIQHDQIRRTNSFFSGLQTDFWKKLLMFILLGGLGFLGGYSADLTKTQKPTVEKHAITRDEYQKPKQGPYNEPSNP